MTSPPVSHRSLGSRCVSLGTLRILYALLPTGHLQALAPCNYSLTVTTRLGYLTNRALNSTAPDPLVMSPFLPGDFITITGFRQGAELIANSIVAQNVMINTLGDLVYVRMELGLLGIDNPSPNAEIAESRVRSTKNFQSLDRAQLTNFASIVYRVPV